LFRRRIKHASTQEERQRLIRQWSKRKLLKLSSLLTEAARKSFGNAPRLDAINCKRLALFGLNPITAKKPRKSRKKAFICCSCSEPTERRCFLPCHKQHLLCSDCRFRLIAVDNARCPLCRKNFAE